MVLVIEGLTRLKTAITHAVRTRVNANYHVTLFASPRSLFHATTMDTDVPDKVYPRIGSMLNLILLVDYDTDLFGFLDYTIRDCIGGGGFSRVFRAINYETRATAACKVVLITSDTPPSQRKDLEKEIKVHSLLKHINVLEFLRYKVCSFDWRGRGL